MIPEPERHVLKWPEQGVEMGFRLIPAGSFRMGSRGFDDVEAPAHLVRITRPFWLAETPVTQAQFALWTSSAGIQHKNGFPGNPDHPAENVTWRQANEYCDWLARHQGVKFPKGYSLACLPTEAEWEYACRAGTETEYYTGDGEAAMEEAGWFNRNSESSTRPVRKKKPNALGLYDLHGNVWEWCHDIWDVAAYRQRLNGVDDPWARERNDEWLAGLKRMLASEDLRPSRGGSWPFTAWDCRSASRVRLRPIESDERFGFRVCLVSGFAVAKASAFALRTAARRDIDQVHESSAGGAKGRDKLPGP